MIRPFAPLFTLGVATLAACRAGPTNPVAASESGSPLAFAAVSVGDGSACGLTTAGAAYCWGANGAGELGDGTTTPSPTPVAVAGGLTFTTVSEGTGHTCGVTTDGTAYCWGTNVSGELGNDSATYPDPRDHPAPTPVPVVGGLRIETVSAGDYYTCGLTTGGAAYCWGGFTIYWGGGGSKRPVPVPGGLTFEALSSASCGVTVGGVAYCWGHDSTGHDSTAQPVVVGGGGLTFASVSVGVNGGRCGLTTAGAAYCWGDSRASSATVRRSTAIRRSRWPVG
jgi:hypothetical protein